MKYANVEDVMSSFPHPVLPKVQGEPDYQKIHATRKFLQFEVTTFLMTEATLRMDPLSVSCSGDLFPKKNRLPRRLRALETER
jgi:hypothetical protein